MKHQLSMPTPASFLNHLFAAFHMRAEVSSAQHDSQERCFFCLINMWLWIQRSCQDLSHAPKSTFLCVLFNLNIIFPIIFSSEILESRAQSLKLLICSEKGLNRCLNYCDSCFREKWALLWVTDKENEKISKMHCLLLRVSQNLVRKVDT